MAGMTTGEVAGTASMAGRKIPGVAGMDGRNIPGVAGMDGMSGRYGRYYRYRCGRYYRYGRYVRYDLYTHTCDMRSHLCVCVQNPFWIVCGMCMRAACFRACDVGPYFCTLLEQNCQKMLFYNPVLEHLVLL